MIWIEDPSLMHIKNVLFEFRPMEKKIEGCTSIILGKDLTIGKQKDPRFCISMDPKGGWVLIIGILGMSGKELKSQ